MRDTSGDMSDGRKWIKGKDGKLKGSISKSSAEGLTKQQQKEYNELITDISDNERHIVEEMVFRNFPLYVRKDIVQVCPLQYDYIYYVKILNDKGDCNVIGKRLPPERARKK